MSYSQVRDILDRVRSCHKRFRDALGRIEQYSQQASAEWLAKSIRQHEQHWQMALAKEGGEDEHAVLETWIQVVPNDPILQELDDIVIKPDMTIDEVAELGIRFHTTLVNLYETLATQVSAPRAKELFTRLHELEQTVVAKQAWAARDE